MEKTDFSTDVFGSKEMLQPSPVDKIPQQGTRPDIAYQMVKDDILDGLRLFEDITYADSIGRRFYALPDGSYLYIKDGVQQLYGEAYLIEDGSFRQISRVGDVLPL